MNLLLSPDWFIPSVSLFGLLIGSFLNVVILRLPIKTKQAWKKECMAFLEMPAPEEEESPGLIMDRSRCPNCGHLIAALENIPLLSFLMLGGKCSACKKPISLRYPAIELLTAILSGLITWKFGPHEQTAFALLLTYGLICLAVIDIEHQLLFDSITLPLTWLGLFLALFDTFADYSSSLIGAIAGYMSLWLVYQLFKLLTGKEGMGFGDFKLLALFGAWLGWQVLPLIIMLSSTIGALAGSLMILFFKHEKSNPIPFGPYLAAAGWIALLWGKDINALYLNFVGLH